jgi:hypothetical protein
MHVKFNLIYAQLKIKKILRKSSKLATGSVNPVIIVSFVLPSDVRL